MPRPVTPLAAIDRRIPEAGRIRLGIKDGRAMKSIDTFRFTSPHRDLIDGLAAQYGGTARPWSDPKAKIKDQWEVVTTTSEMDVYLPPGALSVWYELWSGGGIQRRCDGDDCQVPTTTQDGWEMTTRPCLCAAAGALACRPHTRINVIIPSIDFRGVWRLETLGWNAAHEMPGMADIIDSLTDHGSTVTAALKIERRVQQTPAGKRNFVVPVLSMRATPQQMLTGQANVAALASTVPTAAALPAAPPPQPVDNPVDDDIIDADVVTDEEIAVADCARQYGVDARLLWAAIHTAAHDGTPGKGDPADRIRTAIDAMRAGRLQPIGFNPDGRVIWDRT